MHMCSQLSHVWVRQLRNPGRQLLAPIRWLTSNQITAAAGIKRHTGAQEHGVSWNTLSSDDMIKQARYHGSNGEEPSWAIKPLK
eukprot:1159784-Pelagomonas_calceolata.AAC.1